MQTFPEHLSSVTGQGCKQERQRLTGSYFLPTRRMREPRWLGWGIPLGYATAAVLVGVTLPRVEGRLLSEWTAGISSAAAMAIYSSVAAGMMTLTAVVFSLVFVMVQFSSTSYSPRLVLWISRDPLVSHSIGIFTATFLYAIAALAWVDRQASGKVPFFSAWLVVGLLLASVGVFVRLVHSLGRLQINSVLGFTGDFARQIIDLMYPPLENYGSIPVFAQIPRYSLTQRVIYTGPPRVIQSFDVKVLLRLAESADGVIEIVSAVGDTLVESTPLLQVYGAHRQIREGDLWKAIRTGMQRTFEQDPKYSIQLLRDIAIRALSPAVNDPTTAVQALDQIEDLLHRLGRRCLEIGEILDEAGRLRLVLPVPTWEDFLDIAFSEIRSYGGSSLQVVRRMKALLCDLIRTLPEKRHSALRNQQKRLDATIARSFPDADDQLEASAEDREGLGLNRRRREAGST